MEEGDLLRLETWEEAGVRVGVGPQGYEMIMIRTTT